MSTQPSTENRFNPRKQKPDFLSTIFKFCDWRKYNVLALIYTILLQLVVLVFPGTLFLILYIPCKISEIRTKDLGEKPSEFLLHCLLLPTIGFMTSFKSRKLKMQNMVKYKDLVDRRMEEISKEYNGDFKKFARVLVNHAGRPEQCKFKLQSLTYLIDGTNFGTLAQKYKVDDSDEKFYMDLVF